MKDHNFIIFTDLDGTLLDYNTYQYSEAKPALKFIKKREIPVILSSSKTRVEILKYQDSLGIENYPFIVENGSAIYSKSELLGKEFHNKKIDNLNYVLLGRTYIEIVNFLQNISEKYNYTIYGFHNSSKKEIVNRTQLSEESVEMAMQREFSVPVFYDDKAKEILEAETQNHNYQILFGGRFIHVLGKTDKGKAMQIVMQDFISKYKNQKFKSIAIGDTLNDVAMLKAADIKVLVKKYNNEYDHKVQIDNLIYSPYIGPKGWNHSLLQILESGEKYE